MDEQHEIQQAERLVERPVERPVEQVAGQGSGGETLVIDCETCSERDTSTCDDCMVTFLCDRDPGDAVVVDLGEFRALRVLGESGLVPPLRHTLRS